MYVLFIVLIHLLNYYIMNCFFVDHHGLEMRIRIPQPVWVF